MKKKKLGRDQDEEKIRIRKNQDEEEIRKKNKIG